MAITERLALLVTADSRQAVGAIRNLERDAVRSLATTEDKIDRLGSRFTQVGTVMLTAGGIAAAGLFKAGMAAAELEQAVGGTEAVFHEVAGTIDAFADKAAEAMGLSEQEFRVATTSIGGNLRRMGLDLDEAADQSIQLTQVAADLAATYGGTTAEAVTALGAAFRGEADPAERFNLNLKASVVSAKAVELGLADSTTSVSEHARAQALLALIMEQSSDAQGQFARETDTATGQMAIARAEMENFQAAIGQAVAPILADAAGLVAGLADKFNSLPAPVKETVSQLTVAGTAVALFGGGTLVAVGQVLKFRDTLRQLAQQAPRTAAALSALGKGGLIVGGLAAGATALDKLDDALDGVDLTIQDLAESSEDALVSAFDGIIAATIHLGGSVEDVFAGIAEQGDLGVGVLDRYRDALEATGADVSGLDDFLREHATDQATVNEVTERGAAVVDEYGGNSDRAGRSVRGLAAETKTFADRLDEAVDKMNELFGALSSVEEAEVEFRNTIRGAFDEAGSLITGGADAQQRRDEFTSFLIEARDDALGVAEALGREGVGSEEIRSRLQEMIDQAAQLGDDFGLTSEEVHGLREAIGALPDQVDLIVNSTLLQQLQYAERLAWYLESFSQSGFSDLDYARPPIPGSSNARAKGGPVDRGMAYLVGEEGPELFVPGAAGMVVPNNRLGGGATHFHVDGSTTEMAFARMELIAEKTVASAVWDVD